MIKYLFIDYLLIVPVFLSIAVIKIFKKFGGPQTMFKSTKLFDFFGIYPLHDHYYQPLINPLKYLKFSLEKERFLPGIHLDLPYQISLLQKFNFNEEIKKFKKEGSGFNEYYFNNNSFEKGDAEYLYNIIRYFQPKKIIEIGSGFSTLMAINALRQNKLEDSKYEYKLICIEPYEQSWLENISEITLIRKKVEDINLDFFRQLYENDILFIDSSHVIRPQGDVLFEFLTLLPILNRGVLIHVHDIFTPRDYPPEWILKKRSFWNEQYLLESFLSFNNSFRIMGSLNYLNHLKNKELLEACPFLKEENGAEPSSWWMKKIS